MRGALIASQAEIDAETFAELMGGFAPFSSRVGVAVSGGPDSMALALCVKRWMSESVIPKALISNQTVPLPSPPPCSSCNSGSGIQAVGLIAFIVDHALRPESGAEAEETKARLATLGIESEILRWEHESVSSAIHRTARKARYQLLLEACHRHGLHDLFLAHQKEDQAETILMRLAKGSGIDGLAGIGSQTTRDNVRLLRPFLSVSKQRLIATCEAASLPFITDPSNQSEKYARGRLRNVMPLLEKEGLTVERLTDLGARAAEAQEALNFYTLAFLREASRLDEAGVLRMDLEPLRSVPRATGLRALTACLQAVHAEAYGSERASLVRVLDLLCADQEMKPCTLQGCLIGKNKTYATLMREPSALTEKARISAGQTVLWDGRWEVTLGTQIVGAYEIRPLGNPPHEVLDRLAPDLRHRIPQGRIRAGLPALWHGEHLLFIPLLNQSNIQCRLSTVWPPTIL